MVLARRFRGGVQGVMLFCGADRDGDPTERAAKGGREFCSLLNTSNSPLAATGAGNGTFGPGFVTNDGVLFEA